MGLHKLLEFEGGFLLHQSKLADGSWFPLAEVIRNWAAKR
jgi:hypothetical protein